MTSKRTFQSFKIFRKNVRDAPYVPDDKDNEFIPVPPSFSHSQPLPDIKTNSQIRNKAGETERDK